MKTSAEMRELHEKFSVHNQEVRERHYNIITARVIEKLETVIKKGYDSKINYPLSLDGFLQYLIQDCKLDKNTVYQPLINNLEQLGYKVELKLLDESKPHVAFTSDNIAVSI